MVYYVETNIIAIVVGLVLLQQTRLLTSRNETSQIILNCMLSVLIIFSTSDIAAYCFRGHSFWGVQISNILYFICLAVGSYFWFLFIIVRTSLTRHLIHTVQLTGIPVFLLSFAIVLNPLTGFFFTVDEFLLYHRGPGVFVTWIVEWSYILAALVINILAIRKESLDYKKSELKGYLVFAIPMAVAAVCQMFFYGTTTLQVGFMLSVIMIYVNRQQYQVQRDSLTGLSNKNSFLNYRDSFVGRSRPLQLTMFIIDANRFKQINDTYGHLKGDQALKDIADVLSTSIMVYQKDRLLLYRYAGDEFAIIGGNMTQEDIDSLTRAIDENIQKKNTQNQSIGEKYHLSLSIGYSSSSCTSASEFDALMAAADQKMYQVKKASKAAR